MKIHVNNFEIPDSLSEGPELSEAKGLIREIDKARNNIDYAWNRFEYAAPEYVELAVLELLLAETHYCLLLKRYRLMLGIRKPTCYLNSGLKNHPFYGSLMSTAAGD